MPALSFPRRGGTLRLALALATALVACGAPGPEVAVVNRLAPRVLLRDPSFNGCSWRAVLAYGESTSVKRCLPGSDRVHFGRLDLDAAAGEGAPTWFNYQTVASLDADSGFHRVDVEAGAVEQDFSAPGPFGH